MLPKTGAGLTAAAEDLQARQAQIVALIVATESKLAALKSEIQWPIRAAQRARHSED